MFYKTTRMLDLTIQWISSNGKSVRRITDGKLPHMCVAAIEHSGQATACSVVAITR